MEQKAAKRRYILGFDGIRAIAVIAVILYHFLPNTFSGGYLGVSIFFVVSGYLITDLLIQEFKSKNTIDIKQFYIRRIKRLYPALIFMLIFTASFITLFDRGALLNLRAIIFTNLSYIFNFWEIQHGQSYFQQFSSPSPFTHLWSLSVEGQFYLIWPVIVLLFGKFKIKKRNIIFILTSLVLISAVILAITFDPNNINRAYYGTDSRLFSILIGSTLAYIWPSNQLTKKMAKNNQKVLDYLSFISLIGLAIGFYSLKGQSYFTYYGGMFIFSIFAGLLVATVAAPGTFLVKILNQPFFNWIGTRSYGIYLYQYPVLVFFDQVHFISTKYPLTFFVIEVLTIALMSELSYRFLEQPLRKVTFSDVKNFFKKVFNLKPLEVTCTSLVIFLTIVTIFGLISPQSASNYQTPLEKELAQKEKITNEANIKILAKQREVKIDKTQSKSSQSAVNTQVLNNNFDFSKEELQQLQQIPITAIGDSMLVNVGPTLQKFMPIIINGKVGRQPSTAPELLSTIKASNQLSDNVLIMLGTNGAVSENTVNQVMKIAGSKRQVFWVNSYVKDRQWISENEIIYKKSVKNYSNFHLIDWHSQVKDNLSWLGPDKIHPNNTGDKYLTHLIGSNIVKVISSSDN